MADIFYATTALASSGSSGVASPAMLSLRADVGYGEAGSEVVPCLVSCAGNRGFCHAGVCLRPLLTPVDVRIELTVCVEQSPMACPFDA